MDLVKVAREKQAETQSLDGRQVKRQGRKLLTPVRWTREFLKWKIGFLIFSLPRDKHSLYKG